MSALELKRKADGTRYVQPYLGRSAVTGRPIRPYHQFPPELSDEECLAEAGRWLAESGVGARLGATSALGDLLDVYLDTIGGGRPPANTLRAYRQKYAYLGRLARRDAREVTTHDLELLYARLLNHGGADGRGLAPATVRQLHWFLSGAFRWMVRSGIVDGNPCREIRLPQATYEAMALTEAELSELVAALDAEMASGRGVRREAAFLARVALATGVRCGEACALRVQDFDGWRGLHVAGTVTEALGRVERQPYTKGRRSRNVAVDQSMLALLGEHAGGRRPAQPLATADGSWLRPSSVERCFRQICDAHGLPAEATFHTLRHTHATVLLMNGMDMATVSERLGHADVATTMRTYAHVLPGRDQAAADLFAEVSARTARGGRRGAT